MTVEPLRSREEWLASLPRIYAAAGCLLRDESGRILIVKAGYREYWQFPGGTIDRGEGPVRCSERELEEETGLVKEAGALLAISWTHPSDELDHPAQHLMFDFGTVPDGTPVTVPAGELDTYRWAAVPEALELLGPARSVRLRAALEAAVDGRVRIVTTEMSGF
ncbi:NUDIX domain-containing protein [Kitasatospora sp. SUK 42]|uniref:NUDIX domain-containing protein n=1 Tax=Kitasatospora sp. SUK 42 TaxID=1588882 RepID=UPI0018CA228D|nr:NUDIX hydrolase [Kitasatospora sp. SUK 42]MBV2154706.1 NUDIX hydrolase [Kitasatospora sp. SUK 42]